MSFRVGKLAVDVVGERMAGPGFCLAESVCYGYTRCLGETRLCYWPTIIGCHYFISCYHISIACQPISHDPCGYISIYRERRPIDPEDLRTLVEDLRTALPAIEQIVKSGGIGGPQTMEQANELEQHLQSALKEVQAQKETLRKGAR